MTESSPPAAAPRKNWFRFRLRTLLIAVPLAALLLGWVIRVWYPGYLERRAVAAIEQLGGTVVRNDNQEVVSVELTGKEIDDEKLEQLVPHLAALKKLKTIVLVSNEITDDGLQHLSRVPQLETAYLAGTHVTPDGIAALQKRLPTLTIDMMPPHVKAMKLAARSIFPHAMLALAISPEGFLVGGSGDGRVHTWNPRTKEVVDIFQAHDEWTFAVGFHPNGRILATAGGDNLIKLWDWRSRREVARFVGHDDDVHAIRFTPDGRTLVSAGDDWTVRVWDVATASTRFVLDGHSGTIPGLALSPSGHTAASASRDGTIRLWDIARGQCIGVLEGHGKDVMAVDFHPRRNELASASYDRSVIVWDLTANKPRQTYKDHGDWVFSVAWAPDGSQLVSGAGDGVRLWDANGGKLRWHKTHQRNVSHAVWLNNENIATASADSSVVLQNKASGTRLATLWPRFTSSNETEGDLAAILGE